MVDYSIGKISEIVHGRLQGDPEVVIHGVITDSRKLTSDELFVPIKGERFDGHDFVRGLFEKGLKASFWQNDHKERPEGNLIIVDNVERALQQLSTYWRYDIKAKVIGVTGSSGKTSTKDIIASVLSVKYRVHKTSGNQNNEIGIPLTLLATERDDDFSVVEMGISDINEMIPMVDIVDPDYTVVTNISPAHILKFKSIDTIVREKCLINCKLKDGICFFANEAYGLKKEIRSQKLRNRPVSYGFDSDADLVIEKCEFAENGMRFKTDWFDEWFDLPILGRHQVINACSGIAIGKTFGLSYEEIQEGLSKVTLTVHRLQIRRINGATVIDDTYNSNPGSLKAALELLSAYDEKYDKYAVLGDMLELGDESDNLHAGIGDSIDFSRFRDTYLLGEEMKNLKDNLKNQNINCHHYSDRRELLEDLKQITRENSIILFKASNGLRFYDLISDLEAAYGN